MNLYDICSPTGRHFAEAPFWLGDDHVCASDGHMGVIVPASHVPCATKIAPMWWKTPSADALRDVITPPDDRGPTFVATIGELADWAGPAWEPCPCENAQCGFCDGVGETDCFCDSCDHAHQAECRECKGLGHGCRDCEGTGRMRAPRIGVLGHVGIDRRLLAAVLSCIGDGDDAVDVWLPDGPLLNVHLSANGRHAVVMPWRLRAESDSNVPVYEVST